MNPHFSPIYTLKNLGADIELFGLKPGEPIEVCGVVVTARPNPHGTTKALAFRLEEGGRTLVYASDVGYPPEGPTPEMLELYRGADVLIHDCTYTPADRETRLERGFSSYADATDAAIRAGAKHLIMFHYDQDYSDEFVDGLVGACRARLDEHGGADIRLTAAAEGLELEI